MRNPLSGITTFNTPVPTLAKKDQGSCCSGGSTSGGSSSDGGGGGYNPPAPLIYDQSKLLQDTSGSWYLPFLDIAGTPITNRVPVLVLSNGDAFGFTFTKNFTPNRIYGFSGNYAQTIEVDIR